MVKVPLPPCTPHYSTQIEQATLYNVLRSWRSYISNPIQHNMMPNVVPGVLAYYDIPDLLKLAKDRVRIAD